MEGEAWVLQRPQVALLDIGQHLKRSTAEAPEQASKSIVLVTLSQDARRGSRELRQIQEHGIHWGICETLGHPEQDL